MKINKLQLSGIIFRPISFLLFLFLWITIYVFTAFKASATDITIDFTNRGGPLKKAGLGSLFGVSRISGGFADPTMISGGLLVVSASQGRIGENGSNPFSTESVAPIIRGTGVKMVCRFGDLLYGWPYVWTTYADWMKQVNAATHAVSSSYKDVVLCIAPFNEPDHTLQGAFMTDPTLPAGTYDQKVVWLWTQTVQLIRSIDSSIPIMGPNWQNYRPWERNGEDQVRMQAFLVNAINTNTVPDIMGWHSLGPSPGDVPASLTGYYRPLEQQLNLPGSPKQIIIEEYGPGTSDFEGVPGTVIKHMAEYARYGIDYGSMGIYANGGLLGNTARYAYDYNSQRNAGWYMFNWYKQMTGEYVPVSRWTTRYYQAFDGVASWDNTSKTATVILGGSDDNADVQLLGIGGLAGTQVRVVLESTIWDIFSTDTGAVVENGGDPKTGTYNIFDKTFTCDGSGNLTVPIHRLSQYNAYRLVITASGPPASYPSKYEAEQATVVQSSIYNNALTASASSYVGGINNTGSYVEFANVNAAADGIYVMTVRYASALTVGATHKVTVNGSGQGSVVYDTTSGWTTSELKMVTKRIVLKQGNNIIRLTKGNSYAELDYIDVRPETHRYEAEFAAIHDATASNYPSEINYPDYVGGINNTDSYVEFTIDAPDTSTFAFKITYANGTSGNSTHNLTINGKASGTVTYVPTSGWLADGPITNSNTACINISLNGGLNKVRLTKGNGYAELDYVKLILTTPATITATSSTSFCIGGNVTFNANTGTGLTYQWNVNGSSVNAATASSFKDAAAGNITVSVTENGCTTVSPPIIVTVNPNPLAQITPASSLRFCQGSNVVLNANTGTGLSYQWSNGTGTIAGATNASYTVSGAGSYSLTVTNSNHCSSVSQPVATSVDAPSSVSNAGNAQYITTSSTNLSANVPLSGSGLWSVVYGTGTFSNGSSATAIVNGIAQDSSVLSWTISNGTCTPSSANVIIYKGSAPAYQTINGASLIVSNQTGVSYSVLPVNGVHHHWTIPSGAVITSANADSSMIVVSFGTIAGNILVTESNMFGSTSDNLMVVMPVTTGITGSTSTGNCAVRPNPFSETITVIVKVNTGGPIRITITDLAGRLVSDYTESVAGEYQLGDNLDTGMYVLTVYSGNEINTFKIIKNNN